MLQDISRVFRRGNSHSVLIPKKLWDFLAWRDSDVVSVIADRTKIVITRIPLEKFRDTSIAVGGDGA